MRTSAFSLSLLLFPGSLFAQGIFTKPTEPGSSICPRVIRTRDSLDYGTGTPGFNTTSGNAGAGAGMTAHYQKGGGFIPKGLRKDVSNFAGFSEKGATVPISNFKGKVVVIGLWSVNCDPSMRMLMDFAALSDKRSKFGFEIMAINFDENRPVDGLTGGWRAISSWSTKNRELLDKAPIPMFTPGVGAQGAAQILDPIYSVPLFAVVDAAGKLAHMQVGYETDDVIKALKPILMENLKPATK